MVRGKHVAHVAPPPSQVDRLVEELLAYVSGDRDTHPLVKAAIVHYEIEFIHPFTDGNGRMGRLATPAPARCAFGLRARARGVRDPFAATCVLRSARRGRQEWWGHVLLEFALDATREALAEFLGELHPEPATVDTRLSRARTDFGTREPSRADDSRLFPALSMPTAS